MKIKKLNEETKNFKKTATRLTEDDDIKVSDDGKHIEATVTVTSTGSDAQPATKKDYLIVENALTLALDDALDDARYALEEDNLHKNSNILVRGLPGSSKTATIKNWCRANNCNLYYLDAKNPDISLLTSGAGSIDRRDPDNPAVQAAYSKALDMLDRPNSILFLDELNRQVKDYLRGSLLTLIADRAVAGRGEEGFREFPNLLFTIAAINPAHKNDRGAVQLSDPEKRRFAFHIDFNSEKKTTVSYFNSYYDDLIKKYVKKHPEMTPEVINRITSMCLRQWLGNRIVGDPSFHYTTIDEYSSSDEEGQITCQSTITDIIDYSRGDINRFIAGVDHTALKKSAKDMLKEIASSIVLPNIDNLLAKKSKDLGIDLKVAADTAPLVEPKSIEDEAAEISVDDFFTSREDDADMAATADGIDADKLKDSKVSDVTIEDRLKKFID